MYLYLGCVIYIVMCRANQFGYTKGVAAGVAAWRPNKCRNAVWRLRGSVYHRYSTDIFVYIRKYFCFAQISDWIKGFVSQIDCGDRPDPGNVTGKWKIKNKISINVIIF